MEVKSSRKDKPRRTLIYGPPGVGKSTWAASWPDPIFANFEDGISHIDVMAHPCGSSEDLGDLIGHIKETWGTYRTLVIDSLTNVEDLARKKVCEEHNVKKIEDVGPFGLGMQCVREKFQILTGTLDALNRRGMHIVLIAHAQPKPMSPPGQATHDKWIPNLSRLPSDVIVGWCDEVLFALMRANIVEEKGDFGKRRKVATSSDRLMFSVDGGNQVAKSRLKLPPVMPFNFEEYAKYLPPVVLADSPA